MQQIIIDSDWGGDVLQLSSLLIARPQEYKILGATVTFGNAAHDQNLENAGAMLRLLGMDQHIPRFAGARAPTGQQIPPEGDDAHGGNGLGNLQVTASSVTPASDNAVDFIIRCLSEAPDQSITLIATGPQTNLANAIRREPTVMQKLKEIRIMAGCTQAMPGYRVDKNLERVSPSPIQRRGNITEWAEFNFQQAPEDAATVLTSGIPIVLFPMNCTHQLTFTPARRALLQSAFKESPEILNILTGLMSGSKVIDSAKFGIDATLHDVHTTLSMIQPHLYQGRNGTVTIVTDTDRENLGETHFKPDSKGKHWVAETLTDADAAYQLLVAALKETVKTA